MSGVGIVRDTSFARLVALNAMLNPKFAPKLPGKRFPSPFLFESKIQNIGSRSISVSSDYMQHDSELSDTPKELRKSSSLPDIREHVPKSSVNQRRFTFSVISAPSVSTKRKPDVIWRYKQQRKIPVKTTIVNVDQKEKFLAEQQRSFDSQTFVQHKEPSLEFFPMGATQSSMGKFFGRSENAFAKLGVPPRRGDTVDKNVKTNLRMFKARLNSVYRAKIKQLGISFKFVLSPDEKMSLRRHHFRIHSEPLIPIQTNKASEMKEEFNNYCGRKRTYKNWLYHV